MNLMFPIKTVIILILIISSSQENNSSSLKYEFTQCSEDLIQDIIINNPNQIPINNIYDNLISQKNVKCLSCNEGYFIGYDFENNIPKCIECPNGYFSKGGKFIVNGDYNEWTNEVMSKFHSNTCFYDNVEKDNCTSFNLLDNKMIVSGGGKNIDNSKKINYVAHLNINFNLIKEGRITYLYQKDTIFEDGKYSGEFRFYINYIDDFFDNEITNNINEMNNEENNTKNINWKNYTKILAPGNYSILFQYIKTVSSKLSNDLSLKIKYLEIDGIETAAHECLPCANGFSKKGSSHCSLCESEYIYNKTLKQCEKCPIGQFTKDGFTCELPDKCESKDYYYEINDLCHKETNKQKLIYKLFSSSECNDFGDFKEKEIDCLECPEGKYFKDLEDGKNMICEYCPEGTYSDNTNSKNCQICEGTLKKVTYYNATERKKFKSEIIIVKQTGFLSIEYDVINENEQYNLYLYIDNKLYFDDIKSKTTEIELTLGNHLIELDSKNLYINQIKITNTKEGGGYFCEECEEKYLLINENNSKICVMCEPGYEFNELEKKCIKCKNGEVKEGYGNKNKCRTCPKFTTPDKENKFCQITNFVHYKEDKRLFYFQKYSSEFSNLCKLNNKLCINKLYGPIQDEERNFYYISYNTQSFFQNQDFFFKINTELDLFSPGFIYKLENSNIPNNHKILKQLANKISEVLIVNENNDKGIIVQYTGNEICEKDKNKNINSYLYFKCSKNQYIKDGILIFNSPKLIKKDECNYYFEWKSSSGCPICLTNEAQNMDSSCINGTKFNYYSEISTCIIYEGLKLPEEIINSDNNDNKDTLSDENDILLTKEYQTLSKVYNITFSDKSMEENINQNDNNIKVESKYIINAREQIECVEEYENIKEHFNVIVIILPIIFFIIISLCIFFIFKYRKVRNNYMRLEEEE